MDGNIPEINLEEETPGFLNKITLGKIGLAILLLFLLANSFYLDMLLVNLKPVINKDSNISQPTSTPIMNTSMPNVCPQSCLTQITLATSSAQKNSASPGNSKTITSNNSANSVREFFIPFGSGSSAAGDWKDVSGLQTTIDTGNYHQIKSVFFEASVHIPTGNETAYIRLFNSSDKHPVWFSEVSVTGGTAQLATSPSITLDPGNKTYQVQMKTSLEFQAILDQARLHIITY